MINLCFGLPGTGKSTYARKHKHNVTLDLGHNAFKSDKERTKFYEKLQKFTTNCLLNYSSCSNVYWDTYPEYFTPKLLLPIRNNLTITFAIPSSERKQEILDRVAGRDGADSEFYKLYSKMFDKWRADWIVIYNQWYQMFGKSVVKLIESY